MEKSQLIVINSGSSSIKFAVFELDERLEKLLTGTVENLQVSPTLKIIDSNGKIIKQDVFSADFGYHQFFEMLIQSFESNQFNYRVSAVGHRVVHGGQQYHAPVLITNEILQDLEKLIPFVPLHQPFNLEAIKSISKVYPSLPQVVCFDTGFHHTHPKIADCYGLPKSMTEAGIRRYGFHGLSYEYIMHKFKEINPSKANSRIVVLHLGNGSSMCAIKNGQSIENTMGFSSLDGLLMGTRCGSLDPGVLLYWMRQGKTYPEIEEILYKKSGLLGVSNSSSNMKTLLEEDSESAHFAIELYVYRIRRELGALVAALGGLDVLIFTGGIGENAWQIREKVCLDLDWLQLAIDSDLNKNLNKKNHKIDSPSSKVDVYVIPTNEEWIIANHSYELIKRSV